jgi:hypothetical protein
MTTPQKINSDPNSPQFSPHRARRAQRIEQGAQADMVNFVLHRQAFNSNQLKTSLNGRRVAS